MKSRKKEDNNKLTFAVAIDLKDVPVERDYLLNIDNYILSDNNFIIKEIKVAEKNTINASDWVKICDSNPTHLIVLQATGTAIGDIKVALTKQIPAWIDSLNIIDDKDIKSNLDKTFGFKYLVEGIAEAYQTIYPKDKNYFEFEIKMKK